VKNLELKSRNFYLNKDFRIQLIKNLPCGDFFILFKTKTLQLIQKLSTILVWKAENSFYICNRLAQIEQGKTRYRGDTQAANEGRL
jgi:hypothetical protein